MRVERIDNFDELRRLMPFFTEGLAQMNDTKKTNGGISHAQFTKILIHCVGRPDAGVVVAYNDEDKPVGYGVAFDSTEPFASERSLLLYAVYAKASSKMPRIARLLADKAAELAEEQGYATMFGFNGNFSGATFKWYERFLNMRRYKTVFRRELNK